jgi:hypothetical protein
MIITLITYITSEYSELSGNHRLIECALYDVEVDRLLEFLNEEDREDSKLSIVSTILPEHKATVKPSDIKQVVIRSIDYVYRDGKEMTVNEWESLTRST